MKADMIRLGIIGSGAMGKGLVYQSQITPGVDCVALCDIHIDRCIKILQWLEKPFRVVNSADAMLDVISDGQVAVCTDGLWISQCGMVDAVIEASNAIAPSGLHAVTALEHGKHLILMNSEIDLAFGPLLVKLAEKNGVVYTSCDGDQYGALKHLVDDLILWGFDLVMAGNIKGYLDRYANPTSIVPEADKRNLDYRMCTSYTDGTKLNIEMAIIANACGMSVKIPGMYGPRADHVGDVFQCFDFESLWLDKKPFVDYILGAEPGGGVFAVGYCDDPYQKEMLSYYKMGPGPFYLFYRPYHLCHIEAMGTVFKAVHEGRYLLRPDRGFLANVYAYAKRDLGAGVVLDGIGGYTCYGKIENCSDNLASPGLPVFLADMVTLKQAVPKDGKIIASNIEVDPGRIDFLLYSRAVQAGGQKGVCGS